MGHIPFLLRYARRSLSSNILIPKNWSKHEPLPVPSSLHLVTHLHVNCNRNILAWSLRPEILPRIRRKCHTNDFHVHNFLFLHAERTILSTQYLVLLHRTVHYHWGCPELWICPDPWESEKLAIYLSFCWNNHLRLRIGLFGYSRRSYECMVFGENRTSRCCRKVAERTDGSESWIQEISGDRGFL